MKFFRTTETHKRYWKNRKDWLNGYTSKEAILHPHRRVIVEILKSFHWLSLIEIGCGPGPNLVTIVKNLPGRQVGGVDISADAIAKAQEIFVGGHFQVGSADDIMMSDKSTDTVLSDMCLIYVSPGKIDKYLKEIKRIARNYVVLCEFHSTSWWNRLALKMNSGYYAHNYKKLLQKHGFCDIIKYKLTEEDWPGGDPQKTFGYIWVAKVPKR